MAPAARILAERVPNHGRNGPFQRAYAVHHSSSQEAGFAGVMVAGLVLLAVAVVLALRWRKSSGSRRKRANPTGA